MLKTKLSVSRIVAMAFIALLLTGQALANEAVIENIKKESAGADSCGAGQDQQNTRKWII